MEQHELETLADLISDRINAGQPQLPPPPCRSPEAYKEIFGYTPAEQRHIIDAAGKWIKILDEAGSNIRGTVTKIFVTMVLAAMGVGFAWNISSIVGKLK